MVKKHKAIFFNTQFIKPLRKHIKWEIPWWHIRVSSNNRTHQTQILYKVSCQGSHFVFRFFRIAPASPASSPSSSPGTATPGVPHGRMFEFHQILEDWITENTASVLGLAGRKWSTSFVEIHCDKRGVTGIAALLCNLQEERGPLEAAQRIKINSKSWQNVKTFKKKQDILETDVGD